MEKTTSSQKIYAATGRRKEATARVRVFLDGTGKITINGRDFDGYFNTVAQRTQVQKPLIALDLVSKTDVKANVRGGGLTGQAGAVCLGIARCILNWNPESKATLKQDSLLTRDPRAKERKKYGRKGARKRFQWTKR